MQATYLKDYQASPYKIDSVDLSFTLDEDLTTVVSVMKIKRAAVNSQPLILDGENLTLLSVKLDNETLLADAYQVTAEKLTIANVPEQFELEITTQIKPQENTELSGLYKSNKIFCTQCEAQGFRRISYFLDRPDVLTTFKVTINADKTRYPILLSNGNPIAQGELSNNRHWVTWHDPFLKPSYLFALVAGDLEYLEDFYTTISGRKITLRIYVDKGNLNKTDYAMYCVKQAMQWDEKAYGREYDLDIFMIAAIDDFNMGAMENKGLNIFNSKYILANPAIATDSDYLNVLRVVGHEYFHNWSGNRVTCRDWFQLSLKEGFTIFREQQFMEDMIGFTSERIDEVYSLRSRQFREDAGPLAHPVQPDSYIEINNFYTSTIYNKGAEVIRMLSILLGKKLFREAVDLYFKNYDGKAVTIEEFVKSMETVSGRDLQQFRRWYKQAGTPELFVSWNYDQAQQIFSLTVKQKLPASPGQSDKQSQHIPLLVGLINQAGQELSLQLAGETAAQKETTCLLEITQEQQTFQFVHVANKPVPSLLRNFSAPIKLKTAYTTDDYLFLMRNDSCEFNRWDAGFCWMQQHLLELIKSYQEKKSYQLSHSLTKIFAETLANNDLNKSLIAKLINLPSENNLTDAIETIDIDAIHTVHKYARQEIAKTLRQPLLQVYQREVQFVSDNVEQMRASRQLKNACLNYLSLLDDKESHELAAQQFYTAKNMTDQVAALVAIVNSSSEKREQALEDFYQQWQDEPLVFTTWLAIQAQIDQSDVLMRVKKLLEHAKVSEKNPNQIRSLIGVFSQQNLIHFHNINGEGYDFLAESLLHYDQLNPILTAHLATPFTQWRRFDAQRQRLMRDHLQKLLQHKHLSKDLYEVVSKSLSE